MNKISKNILASVILQIVTIGSGLIIPRLIIQTFGSNVNGLISSITQLANYIALLEGGVASVMMANLYKPLFDHDDELLSTTFEAMRRFFQHISIVFVVYIFSLAVFYPLLINTGFSFKYVSSLTLILGITVFVQYNLSISYKLLLESDNRIYITKTVNCIVIVVNTILVLFGINVYPDIHLIKLCSAAVFIVQPIIFHHYVNKHYNIDKTAKPDSHILSQRWNGFGINLAAFIHSNTDITILTFFSSLYSVSVYNVHSNVSNGIRQLLISFIVSFVPMLGFKLVKNNSDELMRYFRKFEFIVIVFSSFAFSLGASIIVPFVRLYTRGIHDANYNQPVLAIVILIAEWLYCMREPYLELAYQSNHFKDISKYAYCEAGINIITSIVFVQFFGIIGVCIGTVMAMLFRTISQVRFASSVLPGSSALFLKYLLSMAIAGIVSNIIVRFFPVYYSNTVSSFFSLVSLALLTNSLVFILLSLIIEKDMVIWLIRRIKSFF